MIGEPFRFISSYETRCKCVGHGTCLHMRGVEQKKQFENIFFEPTFGYAHTPTAAAACCSKTIFKVFFSRFTKSRMETHR